MSQYNNLGLQIEDRCPLTLEDNPFVGFFHDCSPEQAKIRLEFVLQWIDGLNETSKITLGSMIRAEAAMLKQKIQDFKENAQKDK